MIRSPYFLEREVDWVFRQLENVDQIELDRRLIHDSCATGQSGNDRSGDQRGQPSAVKTMIRMAISSFRD